MWRRTSKVADEPKEGRARGFPSQHYTGASGGVASRSRCRFFSAASMMIAALATTLGWVLATPTLEESAQQKKQRREYDFAISILYGRVA
jgi:hypothetical protein